MNRRLFVNSFPKSGTNLVEKLSRLLGYRRSGRSLAFSSVHGRHELLKRLIRAHGLWGAAVPIGLEAPASVSAAWLRRYINTVPVGSYFSGHAAWSGHLEYLLREAGFKTIQVIRDPRGILSSLTGYAVEEGNEWFPFHSAFAKLSRRELLSFYLRGGYVAEAGMYYSGIREALERAAGWHRSPGALVVRFEDLVGQKGGGSDQVQRETLGAIVDFLEIPGVDISSIQQELFGGTHTFRGGQVDRWVGDFDAELTEAIAKELADLPWLRGLGYDFAWPAAQSPAKG
ncbi:MAG: hypothetical protein Q8Q73_11170 [Stagnimonas sp.]|nr:hypothetical protein [Stagnimonas sp.]